MLSVVGLLRPELMLGNLPITASMVWGMLGAFASYLGFVFSLFAVVEVRNLSNRYFNKQRLPEIGKQLKKINQSMAEPADLKLVDIRAERHFNEMAVVLRQIRKTKIKELFPVIDRAEYNRSQIEIIIQSLPQPTTLASASQQYWKLFGALSELDDEIEAYQKGVAASL